MYPLLAYVCIHDVYLCVPARLPVCVGLTYILYSPTEKNKPKQSKGEQKRFAMQINDVPSEQKGFVFLPAAAAAAVTSLSNG